MTQINFGVWNIEWMNDLFHGEPPTFKSDNDTVRGPRSSNTVLQRRTDITGVINEIDVQVLMIVEGPNRVEELQLFFDDPQINGTWQCAVQQSGTQSIGIAVRTDGNHFSNPPFVHLDSSLSDEAPILKSATDEFQMDTDKDGLMELHKFERRPLYATIHLNNGRDFRVLGVHLKSKGIYDTLEWSAWWAKAEGNRRRLIAQCYQLRRHFLDTYLTNVNTQDIPLIVCGDINDGPGFDASEMKLQASGVETLMGSIWKPNLTLGNALYDTLSPAKQNAMDFSELHTASFRDRLFDNVYQRVWIDHILYSLNVQGWVDQCNVWEDMNLGKIYKVYPHASDHYPVTCSITLP